MAPQPGTLHWGLSFGHAAEMPIGSRLDQKDLGVMARRAWPRSSLASLAQRHIAGATDRPEPCWDEIQTARSRSSHSCQTSIPARRNAENRGISFPRANTSLPTSSCSVSMSKRVLLPFFLAAIADALDLNPKASSRRSQCSLPLDRPRRLRCNVIHHPVHALHLVDDPRGHVA